MTDYLKYAEALEEGGEVADKAISDRAATRAKAMDAVMAIRKKKQEKDWASKVMNWFSSETQKPPVQKPEAVATATSPEIGKPIEQAADGIIEKAAAFKQELADQQNKVNEEAIVLMNQRSLIPGFANTEVGRAFIVGQATDRLGQLGHKTMNYALADKKISPQDAKELKDLMKIMAYKSQDEGWGSFLNSASKLIGQQYETATDPVHNPYVTGAVAATVAAGAGAVTGGVGAVPAGVAGEAATLAAVANRSAIIEGGHAFLDFYSMKHKDGKHVSAKEAAFAAKAVGGINGALETVGFSKAAALIPGLNKFVGGAAAKNPTIKAAILDWTKKYAKGIGAETFTEGMQELPGIVFGAMLQDQDVVKALADPKTAEQVLEVMKETSKGMAVLGAAGGAVSGAGKIKDVRAQRRSDTYQKILDNLMPAEEGQELSPEETPPAPEEGEAQNLPKTEFPPMEKGVKQANRKEREGKSLAAKEKVAEKTPATEKTAGAEVVTPLEKPPVTPKADTPQQTIVTVPASEKTGEVSIQLDPISTPAAVAEDKDGNVTEPILAPEGLTPTVKLELMGEEAEGKPTILFEDGTRLAMPKRIWRVNSPTPIKLGWLTRPAILTNDNEIYEGPQVPAIKNIEEANVATLDALLESRRKSEQAATNAGARIADSEEGPSDVKDVGFVITGPEGTQAAGQHVWVSASLVDQKFKGKFGSLTERLSEKMGENYEKSVGKKVAKEQEKAEKAKAAPVTPEETAFLKQKYVQAYKKRVINGLATGGRDKSELESVAEEALITAARTTLAKVRTPQAQRKEFYKHLRGTVQKKYDESFGVSRRKRAEQKAEGTVPVSLETLPEQTAEQAAGEESTQQIKESQAKAEAERSEVKPPVRTKVYSPEEVAKMTGQTVEQVNAARAKAAERKAAAQKAREEAKAATEKAEETPAIEEKPKAEERRSKEYVPTTKKETDTIFPPGKETSLTIGYLKRDDKLFTRPNGDVSFAKYKTAETKAKEIGGTVIPTERGTYVVATEPQNRVKYTREAVVKGEQQRTENLEAARKEQGPTTESKIGRFAVRALPAGQGFEVLAKHGKETVSEARFNTFPEAKDYIEKRMKPEPKPAKVVEAAPATVPVVIPKPAKAEKTTPERKILSRKEALPELGEVFDAIGDKRLKNKTKFPVKEQIVQPGEPIEIHPTWHDGVFRHTVLKTPKGELQVGRSGSYDTIMSEGHVAGAKTGKIPPGYTLYVIDVGPYVNQISGINIYRATPETKQLEASQAKLTRAEKMTKPRFTGKVAKLHEDVQDNFVQAVKESGVKGPELQKALTNYGKSANLLVTKKNGDVVFNGLKGIQLLANKNPEIESALIIPVGDNQFILFKSEKGQTPDMTELTVSALEYMDKTEGRTKPRVATPLSEKESKLTLYRRGRASGRWWTPNKEYTYGMGSLRENHEISVDLSKLKILDDTSGKKLESLMTPEERKIAGEYFWKDRRKVEPIYDSVLKRNGYDGFKMLDATGEGTEVSDTYYFVKSPKVQEVKESKVGEKAATIETVSPAKEEKVGKSVEAEGESAVEEEQQYIQQPPPKGMMTLDIKDDPKMLDILKNMKGESEIIGLMSAGTRNLLGHLNRVSQKAYDLIDVEAKWIRGGMNEIGFALKNYFSRRDVEEKKGSQVAQDIRDLTIKQFGGKQTRQDLADIMLSAESQTYMNNLSPEQKAKVAPVANMLRKYFDDSQAEFAARGLKLNFKQNQMNRLQAKLDEIANVEKQQEIARLLEEIEATDHTFVDERVHKMSKTLPKTKERKAKLEESLKDIAETEFVHVPYRMVFQKKLGSYLKETDPHRRQRKYMEMRSLLAAKRQVTTLRELMLKKDKNGDYIISADDLNPVNIIMNYAYNKGQDHALLDIRDAIKQYNEIFRISSARPKTSKDGYEWIKVSAPKLTILNTIMTDKEFKEGKKVWIRKDAFLAMSDAMNTGLEQTRYDKFMSIAKMSSFWNPAFMPFYNLIQSIRSGVINPTHPIRSAKMFKRALNDMGGVRAILSTQHKTYSQRYLTALENGMASSPFSNPFESWRDFADQISNKKPGHWSTDALRLLVYNFKRSSPLAKATVIYPLIKSLYMGAYHVTWQLDELFRMQGYNYLIEKGHSPREAAQTIAQLQGDYASIPPRTRKWLNRFFFTPTFKLATMKLYGKLLKSTIQVMSQIIRHPLSWKDRTNKVQRRYFYAAAGVYLVNWMFDAVMTKTLGFERDTWGRRYRKRILNEKGESKDFYITFASPENIIQRFTERVDNAFFEPGIGNPIEKFIQSNKWEFHPVYRNAVSAVINQGDEGKIYSNFDSFSTKLAKGMWYFTSKTFNMLDAIQSRTEFAADAENRKRVVNAWIREYGEGSGRVINAMEAVFGYAYLSEPKERQFGIKLRSMKNEFVKEAYESARDTGKVDPALIQKYMKAQQEVVDKFNKEKKVGGR